MMAPGTYRLKPEIWQSIFSCVIVGNFSGPKPVFALDNGHGTNINFQNIFINLHFKVENTEINIVMQDSDNIVLFLQCKFESNSPMDPTDPAKLKKVEKELVAFMNFKDVTDEEQEAKKLTDEEKELKLKRSSCRKKVELYQQLLF